MEQDMKDVVAESNKDKQETSDEEEKDESPVPLSDYLCSSFEEEDGDLKDKGMAQVFLMLLELSFEMFSLTFFVTVLCLMF
jgi:hypothetical protein